jgi:hypothetical protein
MQTGTAREHELNAQTEPGLHSSSLVQLHSPSVASPPSWQRPSAQSASEVHDSGAGGGASATGRHSYWVRQSASEVQSTKQTHPTESRTQEEPDEQF